MSSTAELNQDSIDTGVRTAEPRPEEHRHVHRSERALARNADVFIWWPGSSEARLIACFNAEVTKVAAQTLLRWIGMPAVLRLSGEVVLKKVSLEHQGKLRYKLVPLKLLESSEVLEVGVYGYYFQGSRRAKPILPGSYNKTFKQHREECLQWMETTPTESHPNGRRKWYELEHHDVQYHDVRDAAKVPHNRCIFTGFMPINSVAGSTSSAPAESVDLRWILPRDMRDKNAAALLPRSMSICDIQLTVAANVLPMRDTVHDLWFGNEFAVDAEDGYRIYTFTEAATKAGLPERLSLPAEAVSSHFHDLYFREHLMHTLLLRVNGGALHGLWAVDGDVSEWYDDDDANDEEEEAEEEEEEP